MKYQAILFDLDGTLVDSAPDLINTLNDILIEHGRKPCADASYSQYVSIGSRKLLELGFLGDYPIAFDTLRQQYLSKYQKQNTQNTNFYDGIPELLDMIESHDTPWGIVTNKPTDPTMPIAKHLNLDKRTTAIVCGDSQGDISAGQLAGMSTIACAYGYVHEDDNVQHWGADAIVATPSEILPLIQ